MIIKIIQFQQPISYSNMQNKSESRSRLPQYSSLKEYESIQQFSKRNLKQPNLKSNKKHKNPKSVNPSLSKTKHPSKIIKNNENFNTANIISNELPKTKSTHHQSDHLKKQNRLENRLKRDSSEKMIKTKSVTKLHLKSERKGASPSPLCIREPHPHLEQKAKNSKNATSRSEKQKKASQRSKQDHIIKKSSSKLILTNKQEQNERANKAEHNQRSIRNRASIKTEISSKTHSVIKQQDKNKRSTRIKPKKVASKQIKSERSRPYKMPKPSKTKIQSIVQRSILYSEVSFQEYNHGEHPYQSAFVANDRYFLPYPDLKSIKTQGCQIQNRSNHSLSSKKTAIQAAIKIQKVFRGYITRKYIEEAKYIINKVKIIQSWWRRVLRGRKERLNQKIVSSSNSLITIKDFNETFKTEKQKVFSQSKENTISNHKINFKELIRNILEENEQSQKHSDSASVVRDEQSLDASRDRNHSKDNYIQLKIRDEIKSQRKFNFNSPKSLSSPNSVKTPTDCLFNIREMFSNGGASNEKQKIKELMQSPRITSPQQLKTTPQKIHSQQILPKEAATKIIQPFQTNFTILEQFCMMTINYFRDYPHQMEALVSRLDALKEFRTCLILKTWNSHSICSDQMFEQDETLPADYEYLQAFQRPVLFSRELREAIIHFPEIEIDLSDSEVSGPIHRAFLEFAFDVLEEALYHQHKTTVLSYGKSLNKYVFQSDQSLLQDYFSSALGELYRWAEVLCGLLAELPQQQFVKQQRMKEFLRRMQVWDMGLSHSVAIKVEASQRILLELLREVERELLRLI